MRIRSFVSFTFFEESDPSNAAALVFKDNAGKTLTLTTSLTIASEMRALLSEAFSQIEHADKGPEAQVSPEQIEHFTATASLDEPGEIIILIEGERSGPLLGRMKAEDARSFAALLTIATEHRQQPH